MPDRRTDSHDPDAEGLPPDITLPDRAQYRRGQLKALVAINAISLAILLAMWGLTTDESMVIRLGTWTLTTSARTLTGGAAAIVALFLAINTARWLWTPRHPSEP